MFITPVLRINGRLEAIADLMTTGRQLILADQFKYTLLERGQPAAEWQAQWECGLCYLYKSSIPAYHFELWVDSNFAAPSSSVRPVAFVGRCGNDDDYTIIKW